jgi:hypothetical protein
LTEGFHAGGADAFGVLVEIGKIVAKIKYNKVFFIFSRTEKVFAGPGPTSDKKKIVALLFVSNVLYNCKGEYR